MTDRSTLYDQPESFGWISIILHWLTAIAIIALWFIGKSISTQSGDEIDARRTLHITIGLIAWLSMAGRIVWRMLVKHPHATGQSDFIHRAAKFTHYLMLVAL